MSQMDTVNLELMTVAVNQQISSKIFLHNPRYMIKELPYETGYVISQFIADLPKEPLKTIPFSVPINWFEHFRRDHFPKFVLHRFPVKYQEYEIDLGAVYPKLPIAFPKQKLDIRFVFDNLRRVEEED